MPDRKAALRKYRAHADTYTSRFLLRTLENRRRNIARLGLTNSQIVIDAGCGTGLSFPILQEYIGPEGKIVGIEQSPEMLKQAERLVDRFTWRNVVLIRTTLAITLNADRLSPNVMVRESGW
jgi:demethylmenaquinone methyltransferase/2-methoxy-6-polyprenyl-1,4-benzoquinol methylase